MKNSGRVIPSIKANYMISISPRTTPYELSRGDTLLALDDERYCYLFDFLTALLENGLGAFRGCLNASQHLLCDKVEKENILQDSGWIRVGFLHLNLRRQVLPEN